MKWLIALAAGTLASEDLTCIGAGQLIRMGQITPLTALFGCFLGIYLGDLSLWVIGRLFGRRLLSVPFVARRVDLQQIDRLGRWFDRNSGAAILASRFAPGTRLPMYLAAGLDLLSAADSLDCLANPAAPLVYAHHRRQPGHSTRWGRGRVEV
jgi:membrane protein DedA with SNARE-associated domain